MSSPLTPISGSTPVAHAADEREAQAAPVPQLITVGELLTIVPFSRQHLLRLEKRGRFPRRIRLGANRVAWLKSEVLAWIDERVAERDARRR